MQEIGLGGREQDAVDARREQRETRTICVLAEAGEDRGQRAFQIAAPPPGRH